MKRYFPLAIAILLIIISGLHVSAAMTSANIPVSDETTLDWAEYKFPDLFPEYSRVRYPAIEYQEKTFNARAYVGEWGTRWLAVDSNQEIFGLGDFTDNALMSFEGISSWLDQISEDMFTVTVDDRPAVEVNPSNYYLVSTRDAAFGYPESYLETATTQDDIAIYPCQLEVETVAYPKAWLGSYPLPEINGAPLESSIQRGVWMKDIMLPDNPTFIQGCSGNLKKEFERSLDRLARLNVDYVQVPQWHWALVRDDGSWYVSTSEDNDAALSDDSLEAFVSAAHERGLKVLMYNQIQGIFDGNSAYVPERNLENYRKWLEAFELFMRSRAAYFESIGIDLWEMGCSYCIYHDTGDDSTEENDLFANTYSRIIDEVKGEYTGLTCLNMNSWLSERPDILAKIDFLSTGADTEIESLTSSFNAAIYRDTLLNSWWQSSMESLDRLEKPIILTFGIQSRGNVFDVPGYVEETGCTYSLDPFDISEDGCIQRTMQPDFSLQAIVMEGTFEAIKALNLSNLSMVMIMDYWETDSMYSKDLFPNLGATFRNKPAEGVVQQWYERP